MAGHHPGARHPFATSDIRTEYGFPRWVATTWVPDTSSPIRTPVPDTDSPWLATTSVPNTRSPVQTPVPNTYSPWLDTTRVQAVHRIRYIRLTFISCFVNYFRSRHPFSNLS
eukprot:TRINITY_DN38291_c0_g1_i1.p1 TRINITY_DN38291_c0_g1~~TRINITY_DN38291_c0_g1_i1.p1  ORF type:complete len:112 (+),score=8.01 TRINITY_DN38291_c0_g1_i1:347-682(+)